MNTGLEGKPWYMAAAVGAVLGGVVFGLLYWQVSMKQRTRSALRTPHPGARAQVTEGHAAERNSQFREEVPVGARARQVAAHPAGARNTELLRRIRALTEQGDFDWPASSGNFADRDFYSEWPIGIELAGTYHNLALFFDRIGRFSRIINIENLRVQARSPQTATRTITATFIAKTFVYKEETPPPAAPAAAPVAAPPGAAPPAAKRPASGGGD